MLRKSTEPHFNIEDLTTTHTRAPASHTQPEHRHARDEIGTYSSCTQVQAPRRSVQENAYYTIHTHYSRAVAGNLNSLKRAYLARVATPLCYTDPIREEKKEPFLYTSLSRAIATAAHLRASGMAILTADRCLSLYRIKERKRDRGRQWRHESRIVYNVYRAWTWEWSRSELSSGTAPDACVTRARARELEYKYIAAFLSRRSTGKSWKKDVGRKKRNAFFSAARDWLLYYIFIYKTRFCASR